MLSYGADSVLDDIKTLIAEHYSVGDVFNLDEVKSWASDNLHVDDLFDESDIIDHVVSKKDISELFDEDEIREAFFEISRDGDSCVIHDRSEA